MCCCDTCRTEDCMWGLTALKTLRKYQHTYGISELGLEIISERESFLTDEIVRLYKLCR